MRFVGPLYGDERFAAYADADVFCLTPPHWEETSVASLEAAASGTTGRADRAGRHSRDRGRRGGFVVPLEITAIRDAIAAALDELGRDG